MRKIKTKQHLFWLNVLATLLLTKISLSNLNHVFSLSKWPEYQKMNKAS
jgi:hypothetical protein